MRALPFLFITSTSCLLTTLIGSSNLAFVPFKQDLGFESCKWRKICDGRALLLIGSTVVSLQWNGESKTKKIAIFNNYIGYMWCFSAKARKCLFLELASNPQFTSVKLHLQWWNSILIWIRKGKNGSWFLGLGNYLLIIHLLGFSPSDQAYNRVILHFPLPPWKSALLMYLCQMCGILIEASRVNGAALHEQN